MKIWYKTVTRRFVNGDRYERGTYPILTERTMSELWKAYYQLDMSAEDILEFLDGVVEKESMR